MSARELVESVVGDAQPKGKLKRFLSRYTHAGDAKSLLKQLRSKFRGTQFAQRAPHPGAQIGSSKEDIAAWAKQMTTRHSHLR